VGYYRSHNRNGLFLSPGDLQLIQRHFPATDNLFLIIKTLRNRACTAGFFFWNDGRIQSEFTHSEAPLIPISASADLESPASPAAVAPEAWLPRPPEFTRRLIRGVVITSVAAAVTFAVIRYWAPKAAPQTPLVAQSSSPARTEMPKPASTRQPLAPSPDPPKRERATAEGQPATTLRGNRTPSISLPLPKTAVATPLAAADPVSLPVEKAPAAATGSPLNGAPLNLPETVITPPPPAAQPPLATPPLLAAAPVATPVTPPTVAPPPRAEGSAPPSPSIPSPVYTRIGPQIIHQAAPAVPRGVGPKITSDVQLDVEVAIDAKGKVTHARVVSTKGAAAGLLAIEALKAAQLFRFQPAQENGRSIASVMVLTFRFDQVGQVNKE
jgi:hypothetical protein